MRSFLIVRYLKLTENLFVDNCLFLISLLRLSGTVAVLLLINNYPGSVCLLNSLEESKLDIELSTGTVVFYNLFGNKEGSNSLVDGSTCLVLHDSGCTDHSTECTTKCRRPSC